MHFVVGVLIVILMIYFQQKDILVVKLLVFMHCPR